MPDSLVFLEHRDGALLPGALGLLEHALAIGCDAAGVVLGEDAERAARSASGVPVVYVCDARELADPLPHARVEALAELVRRTGADNVLLSGSALAAEVAGGLATELEASVIDHLVEIGLDDGELVGTRIDAAAGAVVELSWRGTPRVALTSRSRYEPSSAPGEPSIERFECSFDTAVTAVRLGERRPGTRELRDLGDAAVVVAGGRGVGADGFGLCEELARELHGAVATTGAAVGLGWYPQPALVGQTGRTTSPALYLALGVSGALHHRLGMRGAQTVVGVNRDARAPIFDFADLAVVGDVHDVVPRLITLLRARSGIGQTSLR